MSVSPETFRAAGERWSRFLLLSEPVHDPETALAKIDLGTRRISLNLDALERQGLGHTVEALVAHEIGHHVRYPGSLAVHARLLLLERSLVPFPGYSVVNLFTDLLINDHLAKHYASDFAAVYRAFQDRYVASWERDPGFLFYLALYEERWGLPPGDLIGPAEPALAARFPGYRADAQLLAQDLFGLLPDLYTAFLYFLSVLVHYLPEPEDHEKLAPEDCDCGEPGEDDWARALTPSAAERRAIERAIQEGWLTRDHCERALEPDWRIAGLPGQGTAVAEQVPEIMAAWYRQQAERYLVRPPPEAQWGAELVPTLPIEWEHGDPPAEIDWRATLIERGLTLGVAAPLKRRRMAEVEGWDQRLWRPRLELYLDVSGSMPDPRRRLNAMTLASQILVASALRAEGSARALLYSSEHVAYWSWCRSEVELSRFLMHYIGGGTQFPWPVLVRSLDEGGAPVRVVITDQDFDENVRRLADKGILGRAARDSAPLLLLLHRPDPDNVAAYERLGATVVTVEDMADFPKVAAELARALFADRPEAPRV